jgi:hypothetical protein
MSFSDFSLEFACERFSLAIVDEKDLFAGVDEASVRPLLRSVLDEFIPLATSIHTEKARSEFIVAPILAEIRNLTGHRISLFSGIDLSVDAGLGLTGVCDFILADSSVQLFLRAPVMVVVEAKNDNIKGGLGQCVAEMLAARLVNEREGKARHVIYGAVTTGSLWRFLKLESQTVSIDAAEYSIDRVGKILGILRYCVGDGSTSSGAAA